MSKTIELRKVITALLKTVTNNVYCENASSTATYPYVVYQFEQVDLSTERDDIILTVNVWDRSVSSTVVEELADTIEELLKYNNSPNDKVLPTFYRYLRYPVEDEDKEIRRRELKFQVQNYWIGG